MTRRPSRWLPFIAAAIATALLVAAIWLWMENPHHIEPDIAQGRLDFATPPVLPDAPLVQTFAAHHAHLSGVELLLALYRSDEPLPQGAAFTLTLERLSEPAAPPVVVRLDVSGRAHNKPVRWDFAPLADSEGVTYRLSVAPEADYGAGFWASASEAHAGGALYLDGLAQPGDLWLNTFHHYPLHQALADGFGYALGGLARLPALSVLLGLPGLLAMLACCPRGARRLDPLVWLGLALAASLAFWPLLFLWTGALGLSLRGWPLRLIVAGLSLALAFVATRQARRRRRGRWAWERTLPPIGRLGAPHIALACVLLCAFVTRALQVRYLMVPAWVDSVHHALITRLMMEQGAAPTSLRPYLALDGFHYHFGLHANAAMLGWLAGLAPEQAVLWMGQLLNALASLSVYTLATGWTRRPWAGVAAALVPAALAYMPAYYTSWGRYTQLAGLVLLPPLVLVAGWWWREGPRWRQGPRWREGPRWRGSTRVREGPRRDKRRWAVWRPLALLALLGAGLTLTHYRVLVFYLLLAPCLLALELWRRARPTRFGSRWWARKRATDGGSLAHQREAELSLRSLVGRVAWQGLATALLAAPWILRFALRVFPGVAGTYGGWGASEGVDTNLPVALLNVGWTRPVLHVAAAGAAWALVRRRGEFIAVAAWVAACLLLANLPWIGLPHLWLITNSSVVIAYWVPAALLVGWLVGDVATLIPWAVWRVSRLVGRRVRAGAGDEEAEPAPPARRRRGLADLQTALGLLLGATTLVLAAWGSWRLVDIVNPQTDLVTAEDLVAIVWARDNLPAEARVLVNSRRWQGELRAGTDAGWWLPLLADKQVTLPTVLYGQGGAEMVNAVNSMAEAVETAERFDDPGLLERLRAEGVTHVFVGARGGPLMPAKLDGLPQYRLLYTHGPARVYAYAP